MKGYWVVGATQSAGFTVADFYAIPSMLPMSGIVINKRKLAIIKVLFPRILDVF